MLRLSCLSFIAGLTLIFLSSVVPHADAHPLTFTATTLTLKTNSTFEVDLQYDLDALALGVSITTDDTELVQTLEELSTTEFNTTLERLRRLFERRVRVRFDGTPIPFSVDFPDYGTTQTTNAEIPTVLGLTARLVGNIPENAETVEFFASRAFASVHLTIVDEIRNREARMVLEQGARSTPFEFSDQYEESGRTSVAQQYFWLGVQHIFTQSRDQATGNAGHRIYPRTCFDSNSGCTRFRYAFSTTRGTTDRNVSCVHCDRKYSDCQTHAMAAVRSIWLRITARTRVREFTFSAWTS